MKRALALLVVLGCDRGGQTAGEKKGPSVVVVEADGGAPAGPKSPEKEPNDKITQAQALVPGQVIEGKLDKPKDIDLYKLTVGGNDRQTLHAELTGVPGLDVELALLDQTGAVVSSANDGKAGEPETIGAVTISPGNYFIRVREAPSKDAAAAERDKPYYLSWRVGAVDVNSEQEPNDKPTLATPLAIGQALSGQLSSARDVDFYKVLLHGAAGDGGAAAPPPPVLRIDVGGLDDVVLTVQVQDSIGAKLLERKGGKGEPISLRNVGVKATEPFYYVMIKGSGHNPEGRYSVHVAPEQTAGGAAEQEPNDDKAHATPLAAGATVSGFLAAGDQDWYKLTLPSPQLVRAELSCPERVNVKIAVHDAGGAELYHVDEGGRQEPEVVTDAWLPAGDSYLRVYAGKGESNTDQPYQLSVRVTPDDGTWEHEPNNSAARATPWPAGAPLLRGMISPKGDEDWFRVPPAPGGSKGIVATVRPIERVDLQLFLADDAKNMVKAQGSGDAERVLRAPIDPAKSYYLVVKDARGKESNPRDSYELHLTFE